MSEQGQDQQEKRERVYVNTFVKALRDNKASRVPPKVTQLVENRIGWAGMIGVTTTLGFWWLGAIDGSRAIEAMTWVLGIAIASVMLEDSMTRLFGSLVHTVMHEPTAAPNRAINPFAEREGSADKR